MTVDQPTNPSGEPGGLARPLRSMLFVPGNQLHLLTKVPRWRPDVVVVDLEDAVADDAKEDARHDVAVADLRIPGSLVLVRLNASGTPWFEDDLAAVSESGADGAVLPKADDPAVLHHVRSRLSPGRAEPVLVAGLETAAGVAGARALLAAGVSAAYFGAEDYVADLGGRRTAEGLEVLHARSEVALAGRLNGVPVIDQAVVTLDDPVAFRVDAGRGRDLGYAGKICIHPSQVSLCHEVFSASAQEVAHARRVLDAQGSGVAVVDGEMVDAVHVRMARQVLARQQPAESSGGSS